MQFAIHVQGQDRVDARVFQCPALDHGQRAARPFFRRLKQQFDLAVQIKLMFLQQLGGSQQNGRMGIVAAGMHVVVL